MPLLKKQIAGFKPGGAGPGRGPRLEFRTGRDAKQIAALQALPRGFLEKSALENRVRQLQIAAVEFRAGPGAQPGGKMRRASGH